MRKCAPLKLTMILIAAVVIAPSLNRSAEAGDWFGWHHGQTLWVVNQPTTTQSIVTVPATTMTQLRLAPVTQLPLGTVTAGQTLQFVPSTNAPLTLTPGLTTSVGSSNTFFVVQQGTTSPVGVTLAPQISGNVSGVSVGPGGVTDNDYQVLASGFGGSFLKAQGFEKFLKDQLENLINQKGNVLNQQELTTLLLDAAKGFLSSNGFGFLINDAVEPIIKRLIGKVIQDRQGSQPALPNGNKPAPNGSVIPSGGATFDITGRITLTPTQAGHIKPPPPPGPLPTSLTPSGGQVAPSP